MKTKQIFNTGMADGLQPMWEAYPEGLRDGIRQKQLRERRLAHKRLHRDKKARRN